MRRASIVVACVFTAFAFVFFSPHHDSDAVRTNIVGTWMSVQGEKFTREFETNGTVIDAHVGNSPDSKGNWTLFTKDMPVEGFKGELEAGAMYLAIAMPQSEALYFKIVKIDTRNLELIDLDRDRTRTFTKK